MEDSSDLVAVMGSGYVPQEKSAILSSLCAIGNADFSNAAQPLITVL